jgi:hypothetical protein
LSRDAFSTTKKSLGYLLAIHDVESLVIAVYGDKKSFTALMAEKLFSERAV